MVAQNVTIIVKLIVVYVKNATKAMLWMMKKTVYHVKMIANIVLLMR